MLKLNIEWLMLLSNFKIGFFEFMISLFWIVICLELGKKLLIVVVII